MQPKADKIDSIYSFARLHDISVIFTQCCSASLVENDSPDGTLVVPLESEQTSWIDKVKYSRMINIRKKSGLNEPNTTKSFICRYFDAFQYNANAQKLLDIMAIDQFVLFGHGFDLCVDSSAKGLVAAGKKVHFLTDVSAPSAQGYGPYGTEDSGKTILDYLVKIGVTTGTTEEFFRSFK
jgi:nicotinamidase-related amidase